MPPSLANLLQAQVPAAGVGVQPGMRQLNFQNDDKQRRPRRSRQLVSTGVLCRKASSSICLTMQCFEYVLIGR